MDDRSKLLKDALGTRKPRQQQVQPGAIGSEINKAKNKLVTPASEKQATEGGGGGGGGASWNSRRRRCTAHFRQAAARGERDGLRRLHCTCRRLKPAENEELRRDLDSPSLRHILIDEYQDTEPRDTKSQSS